MSFYNDLTTQLWYDGQWNDESEHVLHRVPAATTRGIANEGGQSDPGSLALELRNVERRYSTAHPTSALYGKLGRNTPIRTYLGTPHIAATTAETTDSTSHVAPSVESPTADGLLICAWAAPHASGSYTEPGSMTAGPGSTDALTTIASGYETITAAGATGTRTATFGVSEDYVSASVLLHGDPPAVAQTGGFSTLLSSIAAQSGRWWVVISYLGWLGASESDQPVPYFPRDTDGGGWIELGDTGSVEVADTDADWFRMKVWAKRVKTTGTHTLWVDNPGGIDSIQSVFFEIGDVGFWSFRSHAEITSMPPRRDLSGNDRYAPISAHGMLHRLGHSSQRPIDSAPKRYISSGTPLAYWPMEGDEEGALLDSPRGSRLRIRPASLTDSARFSSGEQAVPWLPPLFRAEVARDVGLTVMATVPSPRSDTVTKWAVEFAYAQVDTDGILNSSSIRIFRGSLGDSDTWSLLVNITTRNDTLSLNLLVGVSTVYLASGSGIKDLVGDTGLHHVRIEATQDGADIDIRVFIDAAEFALDDNTVTGETLVPIGNVNLAATALTLSDPSGKGYVFFSQLTVWAEDSEASVPDVSETHDAVMGHVGEFPSERVARLCREEGIPYALVGDTDHEEVLLGAQHPRTLLELLREAEVAGGGLLFEPREFLGLTYRTVGSLYNQTPAATLDYANGEIAEPFEPTPDDRYTVNDVTARRLDGGTARKVQIAGPLNVDDPFDDPDGAGVYPVDLELNVLSDALLPSQAGWRRHLGTVDEPRYPTIAVNLVREQELSENQTLVEALASLDPGDRLVIENPPDDLPPDDITQLVLGLAETVDGFRWDLAMNTAPESPYHIAELEHDLYGVIGSDGTVLAEDLDATETGVDVTDTHGYLWTDEAAPFDIFVGGERMTVTTVGAATGNDQTLTVTRSVNGVVKTHTTGDQVRLFNRSYIGL